MLLESPLEREKGGTSVLAITLGLPYVRPTYCAGGSILMGVSSGNVEEANPFICPA